MISIHRCENYTESELQEALDRSLADLGGWGPYV